MLKTVVYSCFLLGIFQATRAQCPSATTASGTHAPSAQICSGDLIFEDTFDTLDLQIWQHELTLGGGGNWEFQWYTNSRYNSYVDNGILYIKPTLVADEFGEDFLSSGTADLSGGSPADECTNPAWYGCERTGTPTDLLNPIKSARIRTVNSLSFRFGRVEVRARLPAGDWLWPAIWLLPRWNQYSTWPVSGEIDLIESRGNRDYVNGSGVNIGSQLISSTLHWGPAWNFNLYQLTHAEKVDPAGYDADFHTYELLWTENDLTFSVDGEAYANFAPPEGGFWELGNLDSSGYDNPWKRNSRLAPFDQEFYLIINLAVGGVAFFPDDVQNPGGKPWENTSGAASTDFWNGRNQWLPTWALDTDTAALQVDYVRIWAL